MPSLVLPPLYAILDPEQTQGRAAEDMLRQLLAGGAAILQLRVKTMTPRDFLELARFARAETHAHGCKLIINDRVDVALACDADGVHLGQDDLPLAAGRKLVGQKIVGVSTHDIEQARDAERKGADYIGFGPMFSTQTKNTGYAARGVEMLGKIRAAVKLPIVAIGGINEQNVTQVWQAGADSAAIISDLLGADDVVAKTQRILAARTRD
ncbi:MAG TPA: thiamine phosphate synthase [Candidatus Limnocylindrales bacterium]|nr:thiamine phosphate synthase [Candidatus Limnocylindrales bacterium]